MLAVALFACTPETPDSGRTTWDAATTVDVPYVVEPGHTLVIEPGVTVTFAAGASLVVHGELVARGTPDAPIVFTGDRAAPWASIVFEADAVSASFDGVDTYAAGSIVEHAIVEHAARGMHVIGAAPYLHAVTFRNNTIPATLDTIGGAGLLVSDGSVARVRACRFEGNVAEAFAFGGGVYVAAADPIFQDNVFAGNVATYGAGLSTDRMAAPIVGNTFSGNDSESEGGGASLVSTVSAVLDNTFVDNHAKNDGAGLHVCVTCNPHAAPYVFDNVVTGNVSDNADPEEGAAGVGAAFLGAMRDNAIHDNVRDGVPSDFGWFHPMDEGWPAWVAEPSIALNWWGTTDRAAIDAAVWDGADDAAHGVVAVDPIRTAPPAGPIPRVVLATRRQHYEDAGDEIPVFLTLYNPGEARAAHLAITRDGAPFAGAVDYPGATPDGDGWAIEMPANAVWFAEIDRTTYDGTSIDDVAWEAVLTDDAGVVLGVPGVARYVLAPAEGS